MVNKLRAAGADVQFSIYPDLMHDSWTKAYNNLDLYKWMLECKTRGEVVEMAIPEEDKVLLNDTK